MEAIIVNGAVVMAEETVEKIMLLNKLWIPDVLIDIIKDYLFVNKATVLRKYYKMCINYSINTLHVGCSDMFDKFGRVRLIHWGIGHRWPLDSSNDCVQLQAVICAVCSEDTSRHMNNNGCCPMEWDGIDETLELSEGVEREKTHEVVDNIMCSSEEEEEEEEDWDW